MNLNNKKLATNKLIKNSISVKKCLNDFGIKVSFFECKDKDNISREFVVSDFFSFSFSSSLIPIP